MTSVCPFSDADMRAVHEYCIYAFVMLINQYDVDIHVFCGPNIFVFLHQETLKFCAPTILQYQQIHYHWQLSRVSVLAVVLCMV